MRDVRLDRWAETLVHYSLRAKKGEYAALTGDLAALPLLEACYEALLRAGVSVEVFLNKRSWTELLMDIGTTEQIGFSTPGFLRAVETCDLLLRVEGETNTKLLANIDPSKQTLASQARQPILKAILERAARGEMRWVLTHFPTAASAQEASMGTHEYEEFILGLCHMNNEDPASIWKAIEKKQQKLVDYLNTKKELHFLNKDGTDLLVNIDGMKWVNCCGKINFPDGEVYTGPNLNAPEGGVNGRVRYSFPTLYRNVEVDRIELEFENGAVTKASASKGEAFLKEMIAQDEGARFVGEIAIGTNPHMNRITKNILFDEKFWGTFHLALGKGYPQTGNTNHSALHWDMIFDMRQGGSIRADGELVSENGEFVPELW